MAAPDSLTLLTDLDRVWDTLAGAVATAGIAHAAGLPGAAELATDAVRMGDTVAARYGLSEVGAFGSLLRDAGRLGAKALPKIAAVAKGSRLLTTIIVVGAGAYVLTQGERTDMALIEAKQQVAAAALDKLPASERVAFAQAAMDELGDGTGIPWKWIIVGALGLALATWAAKRWGGIFA
jgi:hypothetical protein